MKWFQKRGSPAAAPVQLRETGHHPFGLLGGYVPLRSGETRLYRAVREAVPVVDAAIYKLIRMAGGVTAACSDKTGSGRWGNSSAPFRRDGDSMGSTPFWRAIWTLC